MTHDARRYAPSAARNRDAILKTLGQHLPEHGHVLEIASGSGEHITHFAGAHPLLTFQPSDPDPDSHASIDAWSRYLGLTNVAPAILLDTTQRISIPKAIDVVICINMIHIAPWSATVGLLRNAAKLLPMGGLLYLYGPYRRGGTHTAPSNATFDVDLKARNLEWGIRDLEVVAAAGSDHGFSAPFIEDMPANNLSVMFRRR
jgi:SAM-dependent methyltransferase